MNCPVCGSELPSGVKYCPVCGTDVESALMRAQQQASGRPAPASQQAPAQRVPAAYGQAVQQAPYYAPQPQQQYAPQGQQYAQQQYGQPGRAVPMNSSMPRQGQPGLREIDTSQMGGAPKWPIVLIAILAILIVVADEHIIQRNAGFVNRFLKNNQDNFLFLSVFAF